MKDGEVKLRMTLKLDEKWAGNFTQGELADYLKERLNSSLGFRGQVRRLSIAKR